MNIFYIPPLDISTKASFYCCLTSDGLELMNRVYDDPSSVCEYIYSMLRRNRMLWSPLLAELDNMREAGIIRFSESGLQPSQYNLQIIFPINIGSEYERLMKNDV